MKVKTGQIYGDKTLKNEGRSIKVIRVSGDSAFCIPVTEVGGDPAESSEKIEVALEDFENYEILHDPSTVENEKPRALASVVGKKLEAWFQINPIKKWLTTTCTSYPQLSALVGVSVNTIHSWLTGRNPSDDNFPIIAAAIGMSESEFRTAWKDWQSRRPAP